MINKKKTGLCLALAATLIASSALCGCQQSDSSTSAKFNSDVKDASKYTADENAQVYKTLDFSDEQEKEFAKKGFITAPDKLEIKTENGTVIEGQAMVNQASLTGESLPVKKEIDGYVYAGTVIEEGELTIKVKEVSGSTRYEKIITMIEQSEKLKSAVESKAEHLADKLVP